MQSVLNSVRNLHSNHLIQQHGYLTMTNNVEESLSLVGWLREESLRLSWQRNCGIEKQRHYFSRTETLWSGENISSHVLVAVGG